VRRVAGAVACAALLGVLAVVPSATAETGVPYFTNHDPRAGSELIGYQNWAIAQDRRGVMYFGNSAGVIEYDGVEWRVVPVAGTARSLAADADGTVWVGGQGDLGLLEPGALGGTRFRSLRNELPPGDRDFTDVWKTHALDGRVFFQAYSHLFRWDGRRFTVWRPSSRFHMSFLIRDTVYVREEGRGMLALRGERLELLEWGAEFADDRVYVMLPYGSDALLVGSRERGLFVVDENGVRPFATEAESYLENSQIYHGTVLADGTFAIATLRGGAVLLDRDGRLLHILDRSLGIQDSTVYCVETDDRGGLWMALDRNLARVQIPAAFTVFGEMTGLVGAVQSVLRYEGTLLVATTQGVYRLGPPRATNGRPGTVNSFEPVSGIATQSWHLVDVDDRVLVATNDGVYRVDGLRATRVTELQTLTIEPSSAHPGRLYLGLIDGLAVLERTAAGWRLAGRVDDLNDEVRTVVEGDDGMLWVGGRYHGVVRLDVRGDDPQAWSASRYEEGDGLPVGAGLPRLSLVGDRLLAATSAGVLRYDATRDAFGATTEFGPRFAEPDTWITRVREDHRGDVWMVTESGIGVARRTSDTVESWFDAPFRQLSPRGVWDLTPEPDGVVWFGTSDGLIRYDPGVSSPAPPAFRAIVRSVRRLLDDRMVFHGASPVTGEPVRVTLPFADNSLRFAFAAPAPGLENAVEYSVRLDGQDDRWSSWTREVKREYTNLAEGRYTFRVRARLPGGEISDDGRWSFEIRPPWFRTVWAYLGYVAFGVTALLGLMQLMVARARHVERREAEDRRRRFELQRAQRIQRNMLPSAPPRLPWLDLVAVQHTATEVGGDYYDFFPQEDGRLYIAVGDATGHGLGAGLMVTATRTALLTIREPDLVKVADKVNGVLRRVNLGARLNMALTLVGLTGPDGAGRVRVEASGGGMAPMYVLRGDGTVEERIVSGVPLGALAEPLYERVGLELEPDDVLLLMSDGVPERHHPERGSLGYDGVHRALSDFGRWYRQRRADVGAQDILDFLLEACEGWSPTQVIEDDITVVVAKVRSIEAVPHDSDL
jgi:serine phosphatase RsbU (regulator of sigma subunit)/streptogramin lyase